VIVWVEGVVRATRRQGCEIACAWVREGINKDERPGDSRRN
jgi:hypothetical protein